MRLKLKRTFLTLASLLWMRLIFGFSADTAEESAGLSAVVCRALAGAFVKGFSALSPKEQERIIESLQFFVRKGAHMTEYAVLGVLLALTLASYGLKRAWRGAFFAGTFYAALDELHQRFVPGRSGEVKDVLIDALGVLLGLAAAAGARRFMPRIKEKEKRRTADAGPKR